MAFRFEDFDSVLGKIKEKDSEATRKEALVRTERAKTLSLAQEAAKRLNGTALPTTSSVRGEGAWELVNYHYFRKGGMEDWDSSDGPRGLLLSRSGRLAGFNRPYGYDKNAYNAGSSGVATGGIQWEYGADPFLMEDLVLRENVHHEYGHRPDWYTYNVDMNPNVDQRLAQEELLQRKVLELLVRERLV